jgi:hypothetical protein
MALLTIDVQNDGGWEQARSVDEMWIAMDAGDKAGMKRAMADFAAAVTGRCASILNATTLACMAEQKELRALHAADMIRLDKLDAFMDSLEQCAIERAMGFGERHV